MFLALNSWRGVDSLHVSKKNNVMENFSGMFLRYAVSVYLSRSILRPQFVYMSTVKT